MSRENLPLTGVRLSYSAKFWFIPSDNLTIDILRKPSSASVHNLHPKFISGIEKFHEVDDRITEPRYECDSAKRGNIIGRVTQVIERKISIDRCVLYSDNIGGVFGIDDLINQTSPFGILKTEIAPVGSNIPDTATLYLGCYVHNIPETYELGRDLKMMQSINLGYVEKYKINAA